MPDHSIDAPAEARDARQARSESSAEHIGRRDWRLGGRTVRRWRERLLAIAFFSLGLGLLAGALLISMLPVTWGPMAATGVLWIGMLVPVVWAFTRSRPIGLLRLRPVDLLYGLAIGAALRIAQGWIELALGEDGALPSYPVIGGNLPSGWLFTDVVSPGLIAPVIEELFFRAVLVVALFTVFRRQVGSLFAGVIALLGSTGVFVLAHGLQPSEGAGVVGLIMLGATCSALVLLTGRIWGAVLVHAVFNLSFVALAMAGTFAA
ncbi:CPBP family intramembrane glutamic endopeptidase [Microbacterium sp. P02]|uniref:CPBP family intramembrane glutamic endopeptidase n=1 Tax=Microbacterium sp. P02 TaxID=3366260 RepID=UPI00366FC63D